MKGFSRREFLKASGSAIALPLSTSLTLKGCSFDQEMLTIAYGANLTSWDPTTLLSSLGFREISETTRMYKGSHEAVLTKDVYGLACLELG